MKQVLQKIDFENTELAFKHKGDAELKRTYRLFKKIDSPFLTKIGPPMVSFLLNIRLPVEGLIRKTIFDIFCGGTSLEETGTRSFELYKAGVQTILDFSVEGTKTDEGFDATRDEIIRSVRHAAAHKEVAFTAMKVTGIAHINLLTKKQAGGSLTDEETASLTRSKARLELICKIAAELGQPVFIDAEETWIQDVIDLWAEEMMAKYNTEKSIISTTVQLYRKNGLESLRRMIEKAEAGGWFPAIKVVRGAYIEKERDRAGEMGYPDPMQATKADTDHDFNAALKLCIEHIESTSVCAGTHNQESSALLVQLMAENGLPNNHPNVLFAQLLGMSDHISFNLGNAGYNVAKYLPYGPVKAVLPYLFRRAEENTAIAGQSSRELSLLRKEIIRRGL